MKRLTIALIILVAVLCLGPAAYAADTAVHLDELDIDVRIPQDWVIVLRDTPLSDPGFAVLEDEWGIDGAALLQFMNQNKTYLCAIDVATITEIDVTMVKSEEIQEVYDLNLVSDAEVRELAKA